MTDDNYQTRASVPASGAEPEYGIGQLPEADRHQNIDRERLVEEYGRIRAYFKHRPEDYRDLQRSLNQARTGITYDVYLTKSVHYAAAALILGPLAGIVLTLLLNQLGFIAGLQSPIFFRGGLLSVAEYIGQNRVVFAGFGLSFLLSALIALAIWQIRLTYPRYVTDGRRRNINVTLPHAITFMYALSYGGMDLIEVIDAIAEKEDTYGEVANEFQMIARDIELFGNDMYSALQNARNLTPSRNFEQFLDDMMSVLDAGGEVTAFLEAESDTYLDEAREEQASFLETLALLSEVFVVGFVAAPLFLIVILMMISLLGGNTLEQMGALVYLILPLAMLAFLVLLDTLSEPYRPAKVDFAVDENAIFAGSGSLFVSVLRDRLAVLKEWADIWVRPAAIVPDALSDGQHEQRKYVEYERNRRLQTAREVISDPMAAVNERPLLTLVFTVPSALLLLGVIIITGFASASPAAFLETPLRTTSLLVVFPFLVVAVPLSAFYEQQAGRNREIAGRFPDTLNVLSSANRMGIEFTDALTLIARWSSGPLATELEQVRNDIRWSFDTRGALYAFADRLRVAELTRTLTLIAEGSRSSTDLARVLSIAAEDTRERYRSERRRRGELSSYIAVVVIGFLVYLLVIVLLSDSYLEPIAQAGASAPEIPGQPSSPLSLQNVPIQAYQALFFHSALIQGFGVGLLAGKLSNDSVLNGLKYSIVLILLALIAFTFV